MSYGIDRGSVDGGTRDFRLAHAAGCRFAWLRASFGYAVNGSHLYVPDPCMVIDLPKARAAGLTVGGYIFPDIRLAALAVEDQMGIGWRAALAAGYKVGVDFPLCLDIEFPQGISGTGMTRAQVASWIRRALIALRNLMGAWPLVYTSTRVWDDVDADCLASPHIDVLANCPPPWLARYAYKTREAFHLPPPSTISPPPAPSFARAWTGHQIQGDAVGAPGFSSTVDVDRYNTCVPGSTGPLVEYYQQRLGMVEGTPSTFDDVMRGLVMDFQHARGLDSDSVIGPATSAALMWEHQVAAP